MDGWARLGTERPEVFSPISQYNLLPIICADSDDTNSEWQGERAIDKLRVSEPTSILPEGLNPLQSKIEDGILHGGFLVAGNAYRVKTICCRLILILEAEGVKFSWRRRIDLDTENELPLPPGWVIWASGVSTRRSQLLAREGIHLQGVLGCWVELPNPGFKRPFKVLGNEPVNFINVTPIGDTLIASGGYGWVGERPYVEAAARAEPIAHAFEREVVRLVQVGNDNGFPQKARTAICIRPSLPSGEPLVRRLYDRSSKHHIVMCIGHAAGGFTQSPAMAGSILAILH